MPRHEDYDPDGTGARPHPVHDMPPVLVRQDTTANRYAVPEYHDYWQAVTDVPCPCCKTGTIRWAEAGYVPGYRICDGCGKHFMAKGTSPAPTLIELERED
jgi:hypothetical protein